MIDVKLNCIERGEVQIPISEIMGLVRMFRKKKTKKAPFPKLRLLVTKGGEI